jgi:Mg-chelatase subunit ChlD
MMPRYFFTVQTRLQRLKDDGGTELPDDDKALAHARKLIAYLKDQGDREAWSMIVEDETGRLVSSISI